MEEFFDNELVKKFEDMIENNDELYFDTEELEDIIIYYLELGDLKSAENAVQFGLNLHPGSIEIKVKKLEVLIELEFYTPAKELMKELEHYAGDSTDFLACCAKYYSNLGNPKRAIEYCKKAIELGDELNFLHNFIADECVNLGDPFTALRHYKAALQEDPMDEYALENIMACFVDLKRSNEAIVFLNDYLDAFPYSESAWYEYGQFYFNQKNYEEAIKGFDYLLAINSEAVSVYSNKATCLENLENYKEAISVYEEMLQLEFTKAFTFYKIGLAYKQLKQWIPALVSFQKSLIEDPQFYLSMMEQSNMYEEIGGMKEALYFAKEALQLNENHIEYQKRVAYLYIDAGKFEESLVCLRKLISMEPDRFYNWYACAEVLMLLGEYEDAITLLKDAVKKHKRAELYYQLSNCYFILKKEKEGLKFLEKAKTLDATIALDMEQKYPFIKRK